MGDGSIMLNYKFRDATQDFDVILKTVSGVKDVIAKFADENDLPRDWMNSEFMKGELVMKNKIIYCLNFLWASFIAFSFPICFAWIFLDIIGHSKGYGYDLGSEKDISIMFGCIELLIWCVLALPSNIYVFRKTMKKGKVYLLVPIILYIALAASCLMLTYGGWAAYAKEVFNI